MEAFVGFSFSLTVDRIVFFFKEKVLAASGRVGRIERKRVVQLLLLETWHKVNLT